MRLRLTKLIGLNLLACAIWFPACGAAAAVNLAISGDLDVSGQTGNGSPVNVDLPLTTLPVNTTRTAAGADFNSTGIYNLGPSLFTIVSRQARGGTAGSNTDANGNITFSVSANTTYNANAAFTVREVNAAQPGNATFIVVLDDVTFSTNLFEDIQINNHTPSSTFASGLNNGDFINIFNGSLSGALLTGHTYKLTYDLFSGTPDAGGPDGGAFASGFVSLGIGQPAVTAAAVPLPPAVWGGVCLIAILGVVYAQRGARTLV